MALRTASLARFISVVTGPRATLTVPDSTPSRERVGAVAVAALKAGGVGATAEMSGAEPSMSDQWSTNQAKRWWRGSSVHLVAIGVDVNVAEYLPEAFEAGPYLM